MTATSWISLEQVTAATKTEASLDAKRLGHRMVAWVLVGDEEYRSRCTECLEALVIRPRSRAGARIGGIAAILSCRGKR